MRLNVHISVNVFPSISDFIDVWEEFQTESSSRLKDSMGRASADLQIVVWTSTITGPDYIDRLQKEDYAVQIWVDATVS